MRRGSMLRNLVALTIAGFGVMAPALPSSAAALVHVWVDDLHDTSPQFIGSAEGEPMAYDSALHTAMLVNARFNSQRSAISSVWTSAGAGWSRVGVTPGTGPCPAGQCSGGFKIAYDALHRVMVGVGNCAYSVNDLCTWTWAGGPSWTLVSSSGFTNVDEVALAYDPALSGTVLVAESLNGFTTNPPVTYLWNGSTWAVVANGPSQGPVVSGGAMAYDTAHREIVFHVQILSSTQTWVLRGTTWVRLFPTTEAPTVFAALASDPAEGLVVLTTPGDAETWTWDGTTWQQAIAPQSNTVPVLVGVGSVGISAITYDTTRDAVIGLDDTGVLDLTAVFRPLL